MAESALVVTVPEAELYVSELRERFDPSGSLGMPAHITLLYPFMSPDQITQTVLDQLRLALEPAKGFEFHLARIDRFAVALYLAPEPAGPFVALTEMLARQFPAYLRYGGQYGGIVPHLTVAQASDAEHREAEAQLASTLPRGDGIRASCKEVALFENSSGRWKQMHTFSLAVPRG